MVRNKSKKYKIFPVLEYFNVPNCITSASLISGILTIVFLITGYYKVALTIYPLAIFTDFLDGIFARMLKQESPIGKELDSLSDSVNFCVLPVIISLKLIDLKHVILVPILLLYLISGFLRLSYFSLNGIDETIDNRYFIGLNTLDSSFTLYFLISIYLYTNSVIILYSFIPFFLIYSLLMISTIKFRKYGVFSLTIGSLLPVSMALIWFS